MKHGTRTPPAGILRAAVVCAALASSGCVLADSANEYGFLPIIEIDDRDTGANNANNVDDMPPAEPPRLIFTEILIDAPGEDPSFTERGEYIEIKNIGNGPADPRQITMFLNDLDNPLVGDRILVADWFTDEEREVWEGLQMIQPGEYFVWVRHEDEDVAPITATSEPGYVYDFGRYANGPTLPHQATSRRRLTIGYRYPSGESDLFDTLEWEGHDLLDTITDPDSMAKSTPFAEGQAVGLSQDFETTSGNDDPQNWCVPRAMVGMVAGTPGGPTTCP